MDQLFNTDLLASLPPYAIFAALFFATFVSEDAACVTGGALAADGRLSLVAAIAACFAGIVAGDLGLYFLGRTLGRRAVGTAFVSRFVDERSLGVASEWLERRGAAAVFISRFVVGLRLPTYVAAGVLRTKFPRFALYFIIAALVWTPILVAGAAFSLRSLSGWTLAAAVVAAIVAIRFVLKLSSHRSRRLFVGRVKRLANWEFWPLWIFYAPVVAYVLYLGVRFRGLTTFTAVNPAIPDGGFVGESKADIYRALAASDGARSKMLAFTVVDGAWSDDAIVGAVDEMRRESGVGFPLIVKPDSGERGAGVRRVEDESELVAAVRETDGRVIVQEFFDGVEASVFYIRRPGESRGEIFSITEKVFPTVVGDGRRTLEELILDDPRAVCLAEKYLERNAARLGEIPEKGVATTIVDIGTHSRGAIFLDGERLRSEALEDAVDAVCRGVEGFHFGRFDLRARDFDALSRDADFRIIELNGVTSESTNIYDPKFTLFAAQRVLLRQWRIAFEIGDENRRRGHRATATRELTRSIARHMLGK